MGAPPGISVITVTYNSARTLREHRRLPPGGPYDWLVVDNASHDESVQVATELGGRIIPLPTNVGFSAANNIGVRSCDSDVLLFCNPDVTVTDDGVLTLADRVRREGGIWAPQLVNADGSPQENGRGIPYPHRKVRHMLGRDDPRYQRFAPAGTVAEVVWVMGAALAITRSDFERLRGWDAGFFIYYEDADLCLRAIAAGLPVRVDGDVRWHHGWGRDTKGPSWSAWRHELRSAARFYTRHRECLVPTGARARTLRHRERQAIEDGA